MRAPRGEIGAFRRTSILIAPALLIAFLVAFFVVAAAGQARLQTANDRVRTSQQLQRGLGDYLGLLASAESARHDYLQGGDPASRRAYDAAVAAIRRALDRVHAAYLAGAAGPDRTAELRTLTATELRPLVVADAGAPIAPPTAAAPRRMASIVAAVRAMRGAETRGMLAATAHWRTDLGRSRWFTAFAAALSIGLLIYAIRRVGADLGRRARMAARLRERETELEQLVDERTRELAALSTHLQQVAEQEKAALARELHDELGGLLIAARMDLSWLRSQLGALPEEVDRRFERIRRSLGAGVTLKRRVIEGLRPTLLDNMGLFAALRWQLHESCAGAGLAHEESFPADEPAFDPAAAIAVYRVAQEALTNVLKHSGARHVALAVRIDATAFLLRIADDGRGIARHRPPPATGHGLAAMRQRIAALGGECDARPGRACGTIVSARIPLERMLALAEVQSPAQRAASA